MYCLRSATLNTYKLYWGYYLFTRTSKTELILGVTIVQLYYLRSAKLFHVSYTWGKYLLPEQSPKTEMLRGSDCTIWGQQHLIHPRSTSAICAHASYSHFKIPTKSLSTGKLSILFIQFCVQQNLCNQTCSWNSHKFYQSKQLFQDRYLAKLSTFANFH